MIETKKSFKHDNLTWVSRVRLFHSVAAFADWYKSNGGNVERAEKASRGHGSAWLGGDTVQGALEKCYRGDDSLVAQARTLLEKVNAEGMESPMRSYEASVAGAFPCVPDHIIGRPDSMRRRVESNTDTAPIRVYVDLTCSAGISGHGMTRRGAAVLAFVMALSRERPVELFAKAAVGPRHTSSCRESVAYCIKIPSAPLELSTAAFVLSNQALVRGVMFDAFHNIEHCENSLPWEYNCPPEDLPQEQDTHCVLNRKGFDMQPQDVYVKGVFLHDPLARNPLEWINTQLERARNFQKG